MALPATIRPAISHAVPGARAAPMAPKAKTIAVAINSLRRPRRSASMPPTIAPISDPSSTELTTISSTPEVR
jgi:hypothetical protein